MQNMSRMAKFVLILLAITIASFIIAGVMFYAEYGSTNLKALKINWGNSVNIDETKTAVLSGSSNNAAASGNSAGIDEQKSADGTDIGSIYVSTVSDNITFYQSDTNEVKGHFYGSYSSSDPDYKPEFTMTSSGGVLRINIEYKPHIAPLHFSGNLKLDVYLPASYSGSMDIHTISGNVSIDTMNLENFKCATTSGDLKANEINAKTAELGTTSGSTIISGKFDRISFRSTSGGFSTNSITSGLASFGTTSGNIKINGSADELQFNSTSGDLNADSFNAGTSSLSTISGRIVVRGRPGDVKATSVSGDINLEYSKFENDINISTTSGTTKIKLPENPEFHLSYKTMSGSGKYAFPITITSQAHNSIEGTVVSDRNNITVSSMSGNLDITR